MIRTIRDPQRARHGGRERRRTTPENRVMRRALDALGWAAELPPDDREDSREVLRQTHEEALATLRHNPPNRFTAMLEMRVGPLPAMIVIATFLLGLGVGLSFGGAS